MRKNIAFWTALFLLCLTFIAAACSSTSANAQSSTVGQTTSQSRHISARQLLQLSQKRMSSLQSVHYTLQANVHYSKSPAQNSTASTSGTNALQPLTALAGVHDTEIDGSGDKASSHLSSLQLDEKILEARSGSPFKLSKITSQQTLYLRAYTPTWYTTTEQTFPPTENSDIYIKSGLQQLDSLIKVALDKATLSDRGTTSLAGKNLRHIQATFSTDDEQSLVEIDVENGLFTGENGAEHFQKPTIDFLIDPANGNVYQAASKLQYDAFYVASPTTQTLTFQCSNFDHPVKISLPTQTTPLTSIDQLFR